MKKSNNPYAVRLGDLKPPLQIEACELDRSLHWLIKKILRNHVDGKNLRDQKPDQR
jgi:hypothetical protein